MKPSLPDVNAFVHSVSLLENLIIVGLERSATRHDHLDLWQAGRVVQIDNV